MNLLSYRNVLKTLSVATSIAIFSAAPAYADFVAPTQWTRGSDPKSTYQGWDIFASPAGPNAPNSPGSPPAAVVDAPPFNPNGAANVFDSSGGSFITSGGNIYSFSVPTDIHVTVPNYAAGAATFTTLILQTRTQGTPMDLSTVSLVAGANTYTPVSSALLFSQTLGGFGGLLEDRWFEFQVPGNAASYAFEFKAEESSMSLDRVAVDTIWTSAAQPVLEPNPVPEPATVVLLTLGLAGVVATRLAQRGRRSPSV